MENADKVKTSSKPSDASTKPGLKSSAVQPKAALSAEKTDRRETSGKETKSKSNISKETKVPEEKQASSVILEEEEEEEVLARPIISVDITKIPHKAQSETIPICSNGVEVEVPAVVMASVVTEAVVIEAAATLSGMDGPIVAGSLPNRLSNVDAQVKEGLERLSARQAKAPCDNEPVESSTIVELNPSQESLPKSNDSSGHETIKNRAADKSIEKQNDFVISYDSTTVFVTKGTSAVVTTKADISNSQKDDISTDTANDAGRADKADTTNCTKQISGKNMPKQTVGADETIETQLAISRCEDEDAGSAESANAKSESERIMSYIVTTCEVAVGRDIPVDSRVAAVNGEEEEVDGQQATTEVELADDHVTNPSSSVDSAISESTTDRPTSSQSDAQSTTNRTDTVLSDSSKPSSAMSRTSDDLEREDGYRKLSNTSRKSIPDPVTYEPPPRRKSTAKEQEQDSNELVKEDDSFQTEENLSLNVKEAEESSETKEKDETSDAGDNKKTSNEDETNENEDSSRTKDEDKKEKKEMNNTEEANVTNEDEETSKANQKEEATKENQNEETSKSNQKEEATKENQDEETSNANEDEETSKTNEDEETTKTNGNEETSNPQQNTEEAGTLDPVDATKESKERCDEEQETKIQGKSETQDKSDNHEDSIQKENLSKNDLESSAQEDLHATEESAEKNTKLNQHDNINCEVASEGKDISESKESETKSLTQEDNLQENKTENVLTNETESDAEKDEQIQKSENQQHKSCAESSAAEEENETGKNPEIEMVEEKSKDVEISVERGEPPGQKSTDDKEDDQDPKEKENVEETKEETVSMEEVEASAESETQEVTEERKNEENAEEDQEQTCAANRVQHAVEVAIESQKQEINETDETESKERDAGDEKKPEDAKDAPNDVEETADSDKPQSHPKSPVKRTKSPEKSDGKSVSPITSPPKPRKTPTSPKKPQKSLSPRKKNGLLSPIKTPKTPAADGRKLPPIKAPVGLAPNPNLRNVKSKIGSFDNIKYKPGGGDKKVLTVKLDWKATPRIGSLEKRTKAKSCDEEGKSTTGLETNQNELHESPIQSGDENEEVVPVMFPEKASVDHIEGPPEITTET